MMKPRENEMQYKGLQNIFYNSINIWNTECMRRGHFRFITITEQAKINLLKLSKNLHYF